MAAIKLISYKVNEINDMMKKHPNCTVTAKAS